MAQRNSSDLTLIENCVMGRIEAWETFALKDTGLIEQTVLFTLRRFGVKGNLEDLRDEISQNIFVSLREDDNRRLRRYQSKSGSSFAGWLRVVSSRLVIDYLRGTKGAFNVAFSGYLSDKQGELGLICDAPPA